MQSDRDFLRAIHAWAQHKEQEGKPLPVHVNANGDQRSTRAIAVERFGSYVPQRLWHLENPLAAYRQEQKAARRALALRSGYTPKRPLRTAEEQIAHQRAGRRRTYLKNRERILQAIREKKAKRIINQ